MQDGLWPRVVCASCGFVHKSPSDLELFKSMYTCRMSCGIVWSNVQMIVAHCRACFRGQRRSSTAAIAIPRQQSDCQRDAPSTVHGPPARHSCPNGQRRCPCCVSTLTTLCLHIHNSVSQDWALRYFACAYNLPAFPPPSMSDFSSRLASDEFLVSSCMRLEAASLRLCRNQAPGCLEVYWRLRGALR